MLNSLGFWDKNKITLSEPEDQIEFYLVKKKITCQLLDFTFSSDHRVSVNKKSE